MTEAQNIGQMITEGTKWEQRKQWFSSNLQISIVRMYCRLKKNKKKKSQGYTPLQESETSYIQHYLVTLQIL